MTAWNIFDATLLRRKFIRPQEETGLGLFMRADGLKLYISGSDSIEINEFDLSSAWDISSLSNVHVFSVIGQMVSPEGISFKPDGLKMFVIDEDSAFIYEYTLTSAWDISTASFSSSFDIATETLAPTGIFFREDGFKVYFSSSFEDEVTEYNIASAWDLSTLSFVQSLDVNPQAVRAQNLFLKPDGKKMYLLDFTTAVVNEYDLSTPWDISSASFLQLLDISADDDQPTGIFFKPTGTAMFILGRRDDFIYEYDLIPVIASFSGTPRKKKDSLTVAFADESEKSPTSWSWKRRPSGIKADYVEFSTDENPSEEFDIESPTP